MKTAPCISVILPVYNGADFIETAVRSILDQSFADFELIVIDDGSKDDTARILNSVDDPRLRLTSRENRGLVATLNQGLEMASGDYIARMDADDIAAPDRFEKQLAYMRKHRLNLCGSAIEFIGAKSGKKRYPGKDQELKYGMLFLGRSFPHPTVMAERSLFEHFRYESKYTHAEDSALWLKLLSIPGIRVGNHPQPLLRYRIHPSQVTAKHRDQQVALEKEMLADALALLELPVDASILDCHLALRHKQPVSDAAAIEHYGNWLVKVEEALAPRWGSTPLFAEKWLDFCLLNRQHKDIHGLFSSNPLASKLPWLKRRKLRPQ